MNDRLIALAREGKINQQAGIRDRQHIVINAPVEKVWAVLTDIPCWPLWNKQIKRATSDGLEVGSLFIWKSGNTTIQSTIQQCNPPHELTWTGKAMWLKAIHTWKLDPAGEHQTIVTVEESFEGFLSPVFMSPSRLHSTLRYWLSALKQQAEV
jgi:hypothetical protein